MTGWIVGQFPTALSGKSFFVRGQPPQVSAACRRFFYVLSRNLYIFRKIKDMASNTDPFAPWNGFDRDNPFKPWNGPDRDNPFAPWNDPAGHDWTGEYGKYDCDHWW